MKMPKVPPKLYQNPSSGPRNSGGNQSNNPMPNGGHAVVMRNSIGSGGSGGGGRNHSGQSTLPSSPNNSG